MREYTLIARLTDPVFNPRTEFIRLTAMAIVRRTPLARGNDERDAQRALMACCEWGIREYFTLAPRSVGVMLSDIVQTCQYIRAGLL